jgi:hypothetical protein
MLSNILDCCEQAKTVHMNVHIVQEDLMLKGLCYSTSGAPIRCGHFHGCSMGEGAFGREPSDMCLQTAPTDVCRRTAGSGIVTLTATHRFQNV